MYRPLLFALTWPVRKWRLAAGRCPWCNVPLCLSTMHHGPLAHMRSQVRYCVAYHYFEYDSCIRHSVRTQMTYEDPHGQLPREAREVIDALGYAMHRVVFYQHIDAETLQRYRDEGMDKAIRSCERLADRILVS